MKKIIFALSALLISTLSFAQHEVGSLTIQPKVGMNVSIRSKSFVDLENLSAKESTGVRITGVVAGAEAEYQLTQRLSLAGAVLYSMEGVKSTFAYQGITAKGTLTMDYVNLPVVANFYVVKGLALKAGIQPGFNVKSDLKANVLGFTGSIDPKSVGYEPNKVVFSVPLGLSYEYQNVVVDARYNLCLTDAFKDYKLKNDLLQLTIGYKFSVR